MLSQNNGYAFSEYAGYLLTYPGFPDEAKIRGYAEAALTRETVEYPRLIAFFDRVKPVTNPAKALYALALSSAGRPEARAMAIEAWRGGAMSETSAAALQSQFGRDFTPADHDARMNALLWAGDAYQAQQALNFVSPAARNIFTARLAMLQGNSPEQLGIQVSPDMLRDAGYVYNRIRQLKSSGNYPGVTQLLLIRPKASTPPLDQTKWIGELLGSAKGADAASAVRIAASVDDAFAPGTDVSRAPFKLRDDYTSLMWLGGTRSLNSLGDGNSAAPLFYRYGAAARTPQTRSKGFYWAGRALALRGNASEAARYFEMAAQYPDQFYGMLAHERLGRPLPNLAKSARPARRAPPNAPRSTPGRSPPPCAKPPAISTGRPRCASSARSAISRKPKANTCWSPTLPAASAAATSASSSASRRMKTASAISAPSPSR